MGLIPETSPHYSYALKTARATNARAPHAVELAAPSDNAEDYQLLITYRKYRTTRTIPKNQKKLNLLFFHGNGMNKGLWHYHIDKLYQKYPQLNVVCAFDQVNHCDSAELNRGKIGSSYNWNDGAKDVAKVLTEDEGSVYLDPNSVNICIGHSLGGFQALMTTAREPQLFNATFIINGVTHGSDEYNQGMDKLIYRWMTRNSVVSQFDTKNKDWLAEVTRWMEKESFFKRFHPTILHNMVDDEYRGKYDPKLEYEQINLKTTKDVQYTVYKDGGNSIIEALPSYDGIRTKCYVLYTEHDMISPEGRVNIRRLPNAVHVDVPKRFHLYNAEQPDELMEHFYQWIDETYATAGPRSIRDVETEKQYGTGYRDKRYEDWMAKTLAKF
ncbi:peroxisomal membrane protein Lpx1p [Diutina catenulata]